MLKRIVLGVLFVLLFSGNAFAMLPPNANIQSIQSEKESEPQVLISYNNGFSPDELEKKFLTASKKEHTLFGLINTAILKLFGRATESELTRLQLTLISDKYSQAHVTDSQKMDTIDKISPNTYLLTLKSGSDINSSIATLEKIPGVKSVTPNIRFQAQEATIQSEEPSSMPIQFIVKYKKGQAPEQLANSVENAQASVFGKVSRIAEDVFTGQIGENSPEKKLERLQTFWDKNNYRYSQYVYKNRPTTGPLANTQVITFSNANNYEEILSEYRNLPEVESVIPNFTVYMTTEPDDTYYPDLWAMPKISAPTAWNTTTGSNSITVAVIDSGVDYNHPDLSGRVTKGKDLSTCDDSAEESLGLPPGGCNNPKQQDNDPMDDSGHGTHVAGTIGAIGNNAVGVTGINWSVNILAIKVLGSGGGGPFSNVLEGIQYAADNGAKVINMSLGAHNAGSCASSQNRVAQDAIDYAVGKGVTVVVAAGNDGSDVSSDIFGSCNNAIVVGATTQNDTRPSWSNYGSNVTIAAPGVQILSTIPSVLSPELAQGCPAFPQSNLYRYCQGTSMATPHVAGAAGVLLSLKPDLTPDQVKNYLVSSADQITTDRPIGPRLNLAKAVDLVSGPNPTGTSPQPTTPNPSGPTETQPTGTSPNPTNPNPTSPTETQPTSGPEGTLTISVKLPGIGTENSENNDPKKGERKVTAVLTSTSSEKIVSGNLAYGNGVYSGSISAPAGTYQVAVKLDNTLYKRIPGLYKVSGSNTNTQTVTLVPGDLNDDGILDIFDYNLMITCVTIGCENKGNIADLNDDGLINPADLNILLRQFANRTGD